MLPFSTEQFLGVFAAYNGAVWPMQAVLTTAALFAAVVALRGRRSPRLVVAILASLWAWSGIAYHLFFFSPINGVAVVFGALFLIQAGLFGKAAIDGSFVPWFTTSVKGWTGAVLMAYALIGYPIASLLAGHHYPAAPTFGVPCPLTIFTLGMLLWSEPPVRWTLAAIPLAWAVVGSTAAFSLGMREDLGLTVAAVVTALLLLPRRRAHLSGAT